MEEEVEESWVNSQEFLPPEEEAKSDSSASAGGRAAGGLAREENCSPNIATTDSSNTAIDLNQLSASTDNPFSESSSENAAATILQPASLPAMPSTSSRNVKIVTEIVTQKNADANTLLF